MKNHRNLKLFFLKTSKKKNKIGQGGFGKVYSGKYCGKVVAIKKLSLQYSDIVPEDFKKETEIMAQCNFPNIVRLYGICVAEGKYFMVMEYLERGSLFSILKDPNEQLPWDLRWNIAIDVCRGLNYLHSKNILHRDLKSPNVLLDDQYQAKICDFGLSKIKLTSNSRGLATSNVKGTIRWRAPELCDWNSIPIPKKCSDIYSVGMILWELASRDIPFSNVVDDASVLVFIKKGAKENIPETCPESFKKIILRCWVKPDQRPTATNLVNELETSKPSLQDTGDCIL